MNVPFSNGSQEGNWKEHNCFRCFHEYDLERERWNCDIERDLDTSGPEGVKDDTFRRMGALAAGPLAYVWKCPEFAPILPRADEKP